MLLSDWYAERREKRRQIAKEEGKGEDFNEPPPVEPSTNSQKSTTSNK